MKACREQTLLEEGEMSLDSKETIQGFSAPQKVR